MAGLLAVGIAILLAIVISVSYAFVLRELRQINANLEQLIGLLAEAGRRDEAMAKRHAKTLDAIDQISTGASLVSVPATSRPALLCWLGPFISASIGPVGRRFPVQC